MPNCIVTGCTSKQTKNSAMKGVILHVFPPNLDRIKTWLLQTGQDFGNLDEFAQKVLDGKRTDAYRLCSVHFTPQCYLERASKKALRFDAVPTIFHNRDATSLNGAKYHRLMTLGNRTDVPYKTKEASTQTHPCLGMKILKSLHWKGLSHVVTDLHRIDDIRKKFTKKILDLTLEIIYLLTGEDYAMMKKTSGEQLTPNTYPHMSKGWGRTQSPITETPAPSLSPERNYTKILEVIDNITRLLAGEVPITFQDINVYFSMENLEYLEGHKELYKDVVMENPHHQGKNEVTIKAEVKDEHGETHVKGDKMSIAEEVPPEISTDPRDTGVIEGDIEVKGEEEGHVRIKEEEFPVEISTDTRETLRDVKAEEEEAGLVSIKEEEILPEISTDPSDTMATMGNVNSEEEKDYVRFKEEEMPPEISTGKNYNMETDSTSLHDGETNDEITDDSSDEDPVAPFTTPLHHSTHPSPDPPTQETSFTDHSYPIPHRGEGGEVPSSENDRHPHTCPLCEESFSSKFLLQQHEKAHKRGLPYFCLECGKDYLHKSRFISHRRIHTGEKPYLCSKCGKSFANKPDLVRHHRTHTGEKPFSCAECGKCFTQRVHLVTHQKKHALQKL